VTEAVDVRDAPGGARLKVRVKPRASRDAVVGPERGALVVRVAAPPAEGAANASVVRLVARALGVPPSSVEVVRGAAGREKLLHVAGLRAEEVRARLAEG
jgi:uncharacterized protein (TIGR00251 family)